MSAFTIVSVLFSAIAFQDEAGAPRYTRVEQPVLDVVLYDRERSVEEDEAAALAGGQRVLHRAMLVGTDVFDQLEGHGRYERAVAGETIELAALRHGVDPERLRRLNRMQPGQTFREGDLLCLEHGHRCLPRETVEEIGGVRQLRVVVVELAPEVSVVVGGNARVPRDTPVTRLVLALEYFLHADLDVVLALNEASAPEELIDRMIWLPNANMVRGPIPVEPLAEPPPPPRDDDG